jgi:uncharacterized protein (TIGR02246 family)
MSQADITAVNRAFEEAARKADVERIASLYTGDAIVLPPDASPVRGRDNIKQLWKSVISDMGLTDVKLDTVDLEMAGDTAYEVGKATLTMQPKGGQVTTAAVNFVVVWKNVNGQWRLHRDIWNAAA